MWEYLTEKQGVELSDKYLNDYGNRGWELVVVTNPTQLNRWFTYYFKRLKQIKRESPLQ